MMDILHVGDRVIIDPVNAAHVSMNSTVRRIMAEKEVGVVVEQERVMEGVGEYKKGQRAYVVFPSVGERDMWYCKFLTKVGLSRKTTYGVIKNR